MSPTDSYRWKNFSFDINCTLSDLEENTESIATAIDSCEDKNESQLQGSVHTLVQGHSKLFRGGVAKSHAHKHAAHRGVWGMPRHFSNYVLRACFEPKIVVSSVFPGKQDSWSYYMSMKVCKLPKTVCMLIKYTIVSIVKEQTSSFEQMFV